MNISRTTKLEAPPPTAIRLPVANTQSAAAAEATETVAQTRQEAAHGDQVAARKLAASAAKPVPPPGTGKAFNIKA